jgi:hypothetical protein
MADVGYFNADDQDYSVIDFEPLPQGDYRVVMTESETKRTKNLDGEYVNCKLVVIEGKYANRIVFHKLNLKNQNQVAVKIANAQLGKMIKAVGLQTIRNTSEIHNKPFVISVTVEPGQNGYKPQNKVTDIKAIGTPTTQAPQAVQAPAQPAAPAPAQAPWRQADSQPAPSQAPAQETTLQHEIF